MCPKARCFVLKRTLTRSSTVFGRRQPLITDEPRRYISGSSLPVVYRAFTGRLDLGGPISPASLRAGAVPRMLGFHGLRGATRMRFLQFYVRARSRTGAGFAPLLLLKDDAIDAVGQIASALIELQVLVVGEVALGSVIIDEGHAGTAD